MIGTHRERFNREFSPARCTAFVEEIARRSGGGINFRLSETPAFIPASLVDRLVAVSHELIGQLLDNPDYLEAAAAEVPAPFRLQRGEDRPTFLQIDFGLVRHGDRLEGRLVELQAFPSLYGFQRLLGEMARSFYGFEALTPYLGGHDAGAYTAIVGAAILGGHDPREVVLLEIEPDKQKTRPDFVVTEDVWGVRAIDLGAVQRQRRRLFYDRDGVRTPIARIYNRVIPDELVRAGRAWPFAADDDLDVEWCGGPDWYFRVSKFSLPFLRHPWVPRTSFLSDLEALAGNREDWLLKPLYSFAGTGIVFAPSDEQLAALPPAARRHYVVQERIEFTPAIDTPHGPTQIEVRLMMVRDGNAYRPVLPLGRMGRGRMMGVDHNRGLQWVGAAAVLIDPST
jgi:hypothetical protein